MAQTQTKFDEPTVPLKGKLSKLFWPAVALAQVCRAGTTKDSRLENGFFAMVGGVILFCTPILEHYGVSMRSLNWMLLMMVSYTVFGVVYYRVRSTGR